MLKRMSEQQPNTYADLIRALRGTRSQGAIARLADVPQSEISRYEAGRRPEFGKGYRLARVLGATPAQLDAVVGLNREKEDA